MRHNTLLKLLVVVLSSCCISCNKKPQEETSSEQAIIIDETKTYIAVDGHSSYKIVRAANPTNYEEFAINELKEFFYKATDIMLEDISDENLTYNQDDHYFSIGDTSLAKQASVDASYEELGRDGARLLTKGNMLFLLGASDKGTINAVYDFLSYTFDYDCFAIDEIYIKKTNIAKLLDFDIKDIPSFAERSTSYQVHNNVSFALRVRSQAKTYDWAKWTHSEFHWMDPNKYYSSHPNWYNFEQNQLCLTRDVGDLSTFDYDHTNMRGTYIEGVKKYLISDPNATHMMLGIVDNRKYCTCESCLESDATHGGHSGTRIRFYNAIVKELNEWIEQTYPGRKVMFSCFAYLACFNAPVKYDEATNTYTPYDESVVPVDNLSILWAPLDACYAHPFTDPCNKVSYDSIKGWSAIAKHLYVWNYCTDFTLNFLPFDNFNSIVQNYRLFKSLNVEFFYDQGNEWMSPFFNAMMTYVQTKLMWNVNLNYDDLAKNFMKHYYKDAYEDVFKYFNLVRNRYAVVESLENKDGRHFKATIYLANRNEDLAKDYFPYELLIQMQETLQNGLDKIEKLEDSKEKELLKTRIKTEMLVPRYFLLKHFNSYYSSESLTEMLNEFENDCNNAGLSYDSPQRGTYITSFISNLRGQLL